MAKFYHAYQERLLYGTDMGANAEMYRTTFRILETEDEHFYAMDLFNYHWPLHGFGLPDAVLKKVYADLSLKFALERRETEVSALLAGVAALLALLAATLSLAWFRWHDRSASR